MKIDEHQKQAEQLAGDAIETNSTEPVSKFNPYQDGVSVEKRKDLEILENVSPLLQKNGDD